MRFISKIRNILWIKPGYVAVYDYVKLAVDGVTRPDSGENANLYDGHKRRMRYVQHFQAEPILSNSIYSTSYEGQKFFFKTILLTNASVAKINEKPDNNGILTFTDSTAGSKTYDISM